MAAVLSIFGGLAGLLAAAVSLAFFDAPLLSALLIWTGSGSLIIILGLTRALFPAAHADPHAAQELA
ncbi:MAG: hypothetical protein ACRC6I_18790 [Paracoccaceae bacterium]